MYLLIWMAEWVEPINGELVGVDFFTLENPSGYWPTIKRVVGTFDKDVTLHCIFYGYGGHLFKLRPFPYMYTCSYSCYMLLHIYLWSASDSHLPICTAAPERSLAGGSDQHLLCCGRGSKGCVGKTLCGLQDEGSTTPSISQPRICWKAVEDQH